MPIQCVILDLDGTFTDVSREAAAFSEAYPKLLADLLGRELGSGWDDCLEETRRRASELGWEHGGHVVAPADADPYILATCAAQILLDRVGVLTGDALLRAEVLTAVYRRAYQHTGASFRPDAKEVLEALLARDWPVYVVTNAATDAATAKLEQLGPRGLERLRIRGDARKFHVAPPSRGDARFDALPQKQQVSGLSRPVFLGRGRYFDALSAIWEETGTGPEGTIVCGDIWELDLAMPAALGAQVHLVERERVYDYEIDEVRALGARGGSSRDLRGFLARLGG
ncbi:HAD family hydrolase [Chondromyces crocatus]|uniref:HAD family hydrolase n=1 Tax=Chondromyces crocatus TaxID=52 RepID=A0A0K1EMV7_CHOCO|nr:HAD family hydrolase [Chondromyces crocatus]AKT42156.1 uncharacterized protein CMC5_063790 [Chondromyces crocatus]